MVASGQPDLHSPGGFAPSCNGPVSIPAGVDYPKGKVSLRVLREPSGPVSLLFINDSNQTLKLGAFDSRIPVIEEALAQDGTWKPIEYISYPNMMCGNSFHNVYLPPRKCWKVRGRSYSGAFHTRLRFSLSELSLVSNEFEGDIHPGMFSLGIDRHGFVLGDQPWSLPEDACTGPELAKELKVPPPASPGVWEQVAWTGNWNISELGVGPRRESEASFYFTGMIDERGHVLECKPDFQSATVNLPLVWIEAVVKQLHRARFIPGKLEGDPVPSRLLWEWRPKCHPASLMEAPKGFRSLNAQDYRYREPNFACHLVLMVDDKGEVRELSADGGTKAEQTRLLDRQLTWVKQLKFHPAVVEGKAVPFEARIFLMDENAGLTPARP